MSPEHRKSDNAYEPDGPYNPDTPDLPEDQSWEADRVADREAVAAEQRRRFGGVKAGSAFFGWLTAMGMSVLLTALLAGAGAGVGIGTQTDPTKLSGQSAPTVGIAGAVAVALILFISYYCGGYVAGRMARFHGPRQGVAVWLWAVAIAVLFALLVIAAGSRFNVLSSLNSFPRIPIDEGTLTTGGIIVLVAAALITLVGAVLGGAAGMRYHRRIDRVAPDL